MTRRSCASISASVRFEDRQEKRGMHHLGELLALFTVASLGIFFGAMLTEGLMRRECFT